MITVYDNNKHKQITHSNIFHNVLYMHIRNYGKNKLLESVIQVQHQPESCTIHNKQAHNKVYIAALWHSDICDLKC